MARSPNTRALYRETEKLPAAAAAAGLLCVAMHVVWIYFFSQSIARTARVARGEYICVGAHELAVKETVACCRVRGEMMLLLCMGDMTFPPFFGGRV